MLHLILQETLHHYDQQPYLASMYCVLFTAAYYGLLRVGELTAGEHPIHAADVQIGINKNKILFILRSSKTHSRDTPPQMIKITSKPISNSHDRTLHGFCPFYLIKRYAEKRGPAAGTNEQFFIFSDRSPVKPNHMRNTLKNMLKLARFDPTVYSTHSFRIGRSCDLLQMGFSVETIKKLGRWKSNAVYRYLR